MNEKERSPNFERSLGTTSQFFSYTQDESSHVSGWWMKKEKVGQKLSEAMTKSEKKTRGLQPLDDATEARLPAADSVKWHLGADQQPRDQA